MVSGAEGAFSFHSEEIPPPREHALRVSCPWADSILGCSRAGGPHLGPGMPRFLLLHTIPRALSSPQLFFLSILKPFSKPPRQDRTPQAVPQGSPGSAVPLWDDIPLLGEKRAEGSGSHLGHPGWDFCSTRPSECDKLGTTFLEPCESSQGWGAFPRGPISSLQKKGLGMIMVAVRRVSSTVVAVGGGCGRWPW